MTTASTTAIDKPGWGKRPNRNAAASTEDPIDALIRNQAERSTREEQPPAEDRKGAKKKISVSIDVPLHKRLKHYCVVHDTDVSKLLSELAERFMDSQPK